MDFYCPEEALVVEVDGETHAEEEQVLKDRERDTYLESLGLRVVRYQNRDILMNLDGVLDDLSRRLKTDATSPTPSLQRRG